MSDVIEQSTATEQTGAVNPADAIAAMIAANKRNVPQPESTTPPAGQAPAKAVAPEAAPDEEAEPENSASETTEAVDEENTDEATDGVTDPVNFLEFAEQNPDMLWRIPNKDAEGGFIEIPVSKAAAILGQGSAIHENARKLKTERADFEEYEANRRKELDGLQIGLELTIQPQLETAANELVTLQQYNQQWAQIRDSATDEVQRSEAEAAIRQNSQLIQEKSQFIQANRPKVEQFYQQRSAFVQDQLEKARQSFTDAELKNKATYTELREKLSKDWKGASGSFVPGVPNIDLVSSDEYLLGLIRDGMKFRDGPKVRNSGGSLAATNKPGARAKTAPDNKAEELQKKAQAGDKNAARDLLATLLTANKRRPR
jgi:head-tail adaptor